MNQNFNHMDDPKIPQHEELRSASSFKVPEFYFDSLTDRIMDHVEKDALPKQLKNNMFTVPSEYFETLSERVINQIHTLNTSKKIPTRFITWRMFSAAAVVLIVISFFVINIFKNQAQIDYLANSTEEELLEYVSLYSNDFDQTSLAYLISEEEIRSFEILEDMDTETSDLLIELFE